MGNSKDNSNIERIFPLTPLQEGMYYHYQLNENTTEYVIQDVFFVKGAPDPDAAQIALKGLEVKYDALRTRIMLAKTTGKVWQVVLKNAPIELCEKKAETEEDAYLLADEDRRRGFDLQKDSLLRVTLVRMADGNSFIFWTTSHIIMDGWCTSLIFRDFQKYYDMAAGRAAAENIQRLAEDEKKSFAPYHEYVEWLHGRNMKKGLEYWKNLLSGYEGETKIRSFGTTDKKAGAVKKLYVRSSGKLASEMMKYTKQKNISMCTLVEGALSTVLCQYNYSKDVVYGKVVSGRNADIPGIEQTVGLFINTIPVRMRLDSENEKFGSILERLQKQSADSTEYDYCSLADIQAVSGNSRSLFEVLFDYENYYEAAGATGKIGSLSVESRRAEEETNYPVTIGARCLDEMVLTCMYQSDAYSEREITVLLERIIGVLEAAMAEKEISFDRLPCCLEKEKDLLVKGFNTLADVAYPEAMKVVDVFEKTAEEFPDRIAIKCRQKQMTYRELNEAANRLAHRLKKMGIGPEKKVALYLERSNEMIIAILAVIKARGAYVPINVEYPMERVRYILEDSRPEAVITATLEVEYDGNVINLLKTDVSGESSENPEACGSCDDLIYIIYTSGTTGNPKGAMITDRNVLRLFKNDAFQYDFDREDVWMLFHSFGFDFSVWEMYGALLFGGKLIVLTKDEACDSREVLRVITDEGVTVFNQVPSAFYQFMQTDRAGAGKKLRYLIFGGEALNPVKLRQWHEQNPGVRIINMYGITETTVHVTYKEITEKEIDAGLSDIGGAIPTLAVYLLNGDRLCGVGIPGEICVAGSGVCRGYFNRPELTAEKFIDNPFGEGKLYRSGDLAVWHEDGSLEYLGRIDNQIKVRGFRIELGDIESAIVRTGYIDNAVAILQEDTTGDKQIVAYITSGRRVDVSELKKQIASTIPAYMLPSAIIQLDRIPVTVNGKLDRSALPATVFTPAAVYEAPKDKYEQLVVSVFSEVLGLDSIGATDNFFDMGGHSLKAATATHLINSRGGYSLTIKDLIQYQNARKIAGILRYSDGNNEEIPKAAEKEYYVVSPMQRRMYLLQKLEEDSFNYHIPLAYRLRGEISVERLEEVFNRIIRKYEIFRTGFEVVNGEIYQKIHDYEPYSMEYEDMTEKACDCEITPDSVRSWLKSFMKPFDLSCPPLIRVRLMKTGAEEYALMLDVHHIISDGISISLLCREVFDLYAGNETEEPKLQYKDYSEWLSDRKTEAQEQYWLKEFDTIPEPLDFIKDTEADGDQTVGSSISRELTGLSGAQVNEFTRKNKITPFMLYMSSVMILMSRYTRQEDIVVGCPVSGRNHQDVEKLQGMFVNTLAIRCEAEKNRPFTEFLEEVKGKCLSAYENQEYPFEELVDKLNIPRETSRNPLFDVMLNLNTNIEISNSMPGLQAEPIQLTSDDTKFILTFSVSEYEGRISLGIEYDRQVYSRTTIERMAEHFENLLCDIIRDQNRTIGAFDEKSGAEVSRIEQFNATDSVFDTEKLALDDFERLAGADPDRIAVYTPEREYTYGELNGMANGIAARLRQLKVGRNDAVAVIAERDIYMLAGIYGIVKAGGAYVPISPEYPVSKMEYIINDCKPKAVLTNVDIPGLVCDELLRLEELTCPEASSEYGNPERINESDDIVYIIYTSGTTGNPKGVMNTHKGMINRIKWMNDSYPLGPDDVIMQKTTYTFDVSVWEIFWWGMMGARVYLPLQGDEKDPDRICAGIQKFKVTVMHFVPTMLSISLNFLERNRNRLSDVLSLRSVFCSGEELPADYVELFYELISYDRTKLINLYGPTEASIDVTYYDCRPGDTWIPIGKPISNTKMHILEGTHEYGIGIPGELCIEGVGVARGYRNLEKLTRERFIENLWGRDLRVYRTGDLAMWTESGEIRYLGRIDTQVKLRGFRIELGEVEASLKKIPGIQDAVVLMKKTEKAAHLAAYFVSSVGEMDVSEIKRGLKKYLAEYMIPSEYFMIDSIPYGHNGKLDRQTLLKLQNGRVAVSADYVAPKNELERKLCAIFEEVLSLDRVGVTDNFFDIGGNSILVTRLLFMIKEELGMDIPFRDFYLNARIADIVSRNAADAENSITARTAIADEIVLPELEDVKCTEADETGDILITGVTGLLGHFLLVELYRRTDADIYCLVNAGSAEEAFERVRRKLEESGHEEILSDGRVKIVVGNLEKERLGLSAADYDLLSGSIGTIVHAAAVTKQGYAYEKLKAVNVGATGELIRFAHTYRMKKIEYMSTMSVFNGSSLTVIDEASEPDITFVDETGGYEAGKIVSEGLLKKALETGVESRVYRLGRIGPDMESGFCRQDDFLWQLIKTCFETGSIPDIRMTFDAVPVDRMASWICSIILKSGTERIFHMFDQLDFTIKDIVRWMDEEGVQLELTDEKQWMEKVEAIAREKQDSMCAKLYSILASARNETRKELCSSAAEKYLDAEVKGDMDSTAHMFKQGFSYLRKSGYFN